MHRSLNQRPALSRSQDPLGGFVLAIRTAPISVWRSQALGGYFRSGGLFL